MACGVSCPIDASVMPPEAPGGGCAGGFGLTPPDFDGSISGAAGVEGPLGPLGVPGVPVVPPLDGAGRPNRFASVEFAPRPVFTHGCTRAMFSLRVCSLMA